MMRLRFLFRVSRALVFVLLLTSCAARSTGQDKDIEPSAQIVPPDFLARVESYMALRGEAEEQAPGRKDETTPEKIEAHKQALAQAIQRARAGARPGDVFGAASDDFRRIIRQQLRGPDGKALHLAIGEEKPEGVRLRVNHPYDAQSLSTVPPSLLLALPVLPDGLEYRFANRSLVLRDRDADLIVDYLAGILPPAQAAGARTKKK